MTTYTVSILKESRFTYSVLVDGVRYLTRDSEQSAQKVALCLCKRDYEPTPGLYTEAQNAADSIRRMLPAGDFVIEIGDDNDPESLLSLLRHGK